MGDPASAQHGMTNVGGVTVFGGTYPAMIWQKFMASALANQPIMQFTAPDDTLWPDPTGVDPAGGRDTTSSYDNSSSVSTTTSSAPSQSTTTSSPPTTTTPTVPTSTTSIPKGP
jgi:membrane peptidoglycan carboxypeptidase